MKKLILPVLLVVFGCLFLHSCKDKSTFEDYQVSLGYEYFPLEVGKYRDYIVDSTTYDIGPNEVVIILNSTTYVREAVVDTITDNLDRLGYKIERSERSSLTDPWAVKDIWMMIRTEEQAESLEENLRFVKMVFPLKEGLVWDGNRFIDETLNITIAGETVEIFKSWEYEVDFVAGPIAVDNELYDDAVQITQADNENLIERRFSREQYVKDIGLAYKEMKILDTQCITGCEGQSWEEKAEKGFIVRQSLIDFN
ncbi:MAG: hypothetical protein ACI8P3_002394 [Saprospiraceae bacterium]|jgi:hypothetical protein